MKRRFKDKRKLTCPHCTQETHVAQKLYKHLRTKHKMTHEEAFSQVKHVLTRDRTRQP